jgi:ATP phosphoribosyltransferase regulatory subunit HisZ
VTAEGALIEAILAQEARQLRCDVVCEKSTHHVFGVRVHTNENKTEVYIAPLENTSVRTAIEACFEKVRV